MDIDSIVEKAKETVGKQKEMGYYLTSMYNLGQALTMIIVSSHPDSMERAFDSIKMAVKQAMAQGQESFTLRIAISDDNYYDDPSIRAEYEVSEDDHEEWDDSYVYDEDMKEMRIYLNLPEPIEEIAKEDDQTLKSFLEGAANYIQESLNSYSHNDADDNEGIWKVGISDPAEVFINFNKVG